MGKWSTQIILVLITIAVKAIGQPNSYWEALPNAPMASRIDDVSFVSPTVGWVVNTRGQIWRTADGGQSWDHLVDKPETAFRSVAFLDSSHGFAGNLGTEEYAGATDTVVLYETKNSGIKWTAVETVSGPMPRGLCGMQAVNDTTIVACGRVRGPAFFVRSTDAGQTWTSKDMGSLAAGLVDCYFFSPDSGFVAGLTNSDHFQSHGIILFTADGGASWDTSYVSSQSVEWCWKFSFPSRKVGYVSLQKNSGGPVNVIKTSNGGQTWQEVPFFNQNYYVQGIGFVTDSLGWVGGNSSYPAYETQDGGETWHPVEIGFRLNRFQFFGDSLGYAVGRSVYKFTGIQTNVADESIPESIPVSFKLEQNYPNPISVSGLAGINGETRLTGTTIRYSIPSYGFVSLKVYNILGKEIASLVGKPQDRGVYEVDLDITGLAKGVYIYKLEASGVVETRKMLVLP